MSYTRDNADLITAESDTGLPSAPSSLALLRGAATGANPGVSFVSAVLLTFGISGGAVFTRRIWTASPIDVDLDRRVKYIPTALVRAMLPLTATCIIFMMGYWLGFAGSHVRAQLGHFIFLLFTVLSLLCAFAGFALTVAVFVTGKPQLLVPPRMRLGRTDVSQQH